MAPLGLIGPGISCLPELFPLNQQSTVLNVRAHVQIAPPPPPCVRVMVRGRALTHPLFPSSPNHSSPEGCDGIGQAVIALCRAPQTTGVNHGRTAWLE